MNHLLNRMTLLFVVEGSVTCRHFSSDVFTFILCSVTMVDVAVHWNVSSVSVSEGLNGDPGLTVYRDLTTIQDSIIAQQTVDVTIVGGRWRNS